MNLRNNKENIKREENIKRKRDTVTLFNNEHGGDSWGSSPDNHVKKLNKFNLPGSHHNSQKTIVTETLNNLSLNNEFHYIEFMSAILAHHDNKPDHHETCNFLSLYFANNKKLIWPTNNTPISIIITGDNDAEIHAFDRNNRFMLLSFSIGLSDMMESTILLKELTINSNWKKKDSRELVNLIGFIFKSTVDAFKINNILEITNLNCNLNQPLNWFESKNSFSEACQSLYGGYSLIPQFMLNHTVVENNKNISWITWPQEKFPEHSMYLKFELSTFKFKENPAEADYHSWMFSEANFLNLHSYQYTPASQNYFRFEVYEELYIDTSENFRSNDPLLKHSHKILDVWSSLDSSFGELKDLKKGEILSGTDVMSAFDFLNDNLLKIQTMYLCDASRANGNTDERAQDQIVFRVLMSVAYGNTWYERCGYEAFEFKNFQQGWPDEVTTLSQDPRKYNNARKQLMKLPVCNLYQTLLSLEKVIKNRQYRVLPSDILSELCNKYCDYDLSSSKTNRAITLSALTSAVYNKFKQSRDDSDLTKMYSLLVIPDKYLSAATNRPDYYTHLSSIVSTKFFRKKTNQLQLDAGKKRQAPSLGKF